MDSIDPSTIPTPIVRAVSAEERLRAVTVGRLTRVVGQITLVEYDPAWPILFEREAGKIRGALGPRAWDVSHVGSTSVPGLAAKPVIDILLVVPDSGDEDSYVPDLERVGYSLRIREPEWYQHRVLKSEVPDVNLHVLSVGCAEILRMLTFRDRLRSNPADRDLYLRTKRRLARDRWEFVQQYADAKGAVVEEILGRARAAAPAPLDP